MSKLKNNVRNCIVLIVGYITVTVVEHTVAHEPLIYIHLFMSLLKGLDCDVQS